MASPRNKILMAVGAAVALLAAAWGYVAYFGPQPPSRPLIILEGTIPEANPIAGQPVVIFATISDPDGIAEVELWINGEQIAAQENPHSDINYKGAYDEYGRKIDYLSFSTSLAFVPSAAGNYLAMLRALDGDGYTGDSDPLPILVSDRDFDEAAEVGEYIAQEGDTPESLAELFGTTVEDINALNPNLGEMGAGTPLLIPASPEGEAAGDPEEGALTEDVPVVDPPPAPSPSGEAVEPESDTGSWWSGLPLPSGFLCFVNPASCARTIDIEPAPFPGPSDLTATLGEGCAIDVAWRDNSETELGFRVYRITQRPRFAYDLIALLRGSSGSGTVLHFVDEDPSAGEIFYAVAAYNAGGNTWTPLSDLIESEGCPSEEPAAQQALVVEALSMDSPATSDRLYCYASLADSPYERVPLGAGNFLTFGGTSGWNIAEHLAGENRRAVVVPAEGPLDIVLDCYGWAGDELFRLGRYEHSHPPADWDGRIFHAVPPSDNFDITYRINPSFGFLEEGDHIARWPLVDPSLPVPFNLRVSTDPWFTCDEDAVTDPNRCALIFGPIIEWDYEYLPEGPRPIGFEIYRRSGDAVLLDLPLSNCIEDPAYAYYCETGGAPGPLDLISPPLDLDCDVSTFFSVSAVYSAESLGTGGTGGHVNSALSEELEFPASCGAIEITLDDLYVSSVSDGDPCTVFDDCRNDYEGYGWMSFNGRRVRWNDHCDPGFLEGCATVGPSYSRLLEGSFHNWSDFNLNIGDGWRRNNNVIRLPVLNGSTLTFMLRFKDHDSGSADDLWCGGTGRNLITVGPLTAEEWLSLNQGFDIDGGHCNVSFTVRGLPGPAD